MSTDKVKIKCLSSNAIFKQELDFEPKEGQHIIGLVIATHNYTGENEWEIKSPSIPDNDTLKELLNCDDPGISCITLTHHTNERGLFSAKWYFVLYQIPSSSYYKSTKLDEEYNGEVNVEIVLSFPGDGPYTRVINYKYETDGSYPLRLNDIDLEILFEDMINESTHGFTKSEDGEISLLTYDAMGVERDINIDSVDEVLEAVASIRLI